LSVVSLSVSNDKDEKGLLVTINDLDTIKNHVKIGSMDEQCLSNVNDFISCLVNGFNQRLENEINRIKKMVETSEKENQDKIESNYNSIITYLQQENLKTQKENIKIKKKMT